MTYFGETAVTERYTWWFMVTVTTVGYGDISPSSSGGQWIAIIVMILGIGALALIIGKIAEGVVRMSEKQYKGLVSLNEEDHIIIMGYREDSTLKLIDEILGDKEREKREIILCSTKLEENPAKGRVKFVRAKDLSSNDLHKRACVDKASRVIVHGDDDDQSFFTAWAVRQVNTHAHMVVYMNNEDHRDKVYSMPADHRDLNQVIVPSSTYLMVQEMQDREASNVLQHMMSNLEGPTLYRVDIPAEMYQEWIFSDVFLGFRTKFGLTVLAVKNGDVITNPPMDMVIRGGMVIFYIGEKRAKIPWNELEFMKA